MIGSKPFSISENNYQYSKSGIKPATPDVILFDEEAVSIEVMTDLIFEDIGGQEIINISRNDTINGQEVLYQPIKNITSLNFQYNPNNILALQTTSANYFKGFGIELSEYFPDCGSGYLIIDGSAVQTCRSVYLDPVTGDLVINVVNSTDVDEVEVEILNAGDLLSGTIYGGV